MIDAVERRPRLKPPIGPLFSHFSSRIGITYEFNRADTYTDGDPGLEWKPVSEAVANERATVYAWHSG